MQTLAAIILPLPAPHLCLAARSTASCRGPSHGRLPPSPSVFQASLPMICSGVVTPAAQPSRAGLPVGRIGHLRAGAGKGGRISRCCTLTELRTSHPGWRAATCALCLVLQTTVRTACKPKLSLEPAATASPGVQRHRRRKLGAPRRRERRGGATAGVPHHRHLEEVQGSLRCGGCVRDTALNTLNAASDWAT